MYPAAPVRARVCRVGRRSLHEEGAPGKYRLQVVNDGEPLSKARDLGIRQALDQLDAGEGLSLAKVVRQGDRVQPRAGRKL